MNPPIKILECIAATVEEYGKERAAARLKISPFVLSSMLSWHPKKKLNTAILRQMYAHFSLEFDDFYFYNYFLAYNKKRHEGIIGNIFRIRRIERGLTIVAVARALKIDEKTIDRLERGCQLPSSNSYSIQKMMELYGFTPEERRAIIQAIEAIRAAHRTFRHSLKKIPHHFDESTP